VRFSAVKIPLSAAEIPLSAAEIPLAVAGIPPCMVQKNLRGSWLIYCNINNYVKAADF
jgi:hypothetical protein